MDLLYNNKKLLMFHIASGFSIIASAFVILFAYFFPDSYSVYNKYLLSQAKGQDIVTLFLVLPPMIFVLVKSLNKSVAASLFLAGCLGYMFYTYVTFSYLTYARLSLIYIAIYSISLFGLIDFFININYSRVAVYLSKASINRFTSYYNITIGLLIALLWLKNLSVSLITGVIPKEILLNNGSSVVYANDLGFFLPAIVLSGILLLKKMTFGFILTAVVLVKEVMMGAAILGMIYVMYLDKQPVDLGMAVVFAVITILSLAATILFYSQMFGKKQSNR